MSIEVSYEMGAGYAPRIVRIVTTDTLTQVTTAGWLNKAVNKDGLSLLPTDKVLCYYGKGSAAPGNAMFDVAFSAAGIITLSVSETDVVLPVADGYMAVFDGATGRIRMNNTGVSKNKGSVQAGESGVPGSLISYPTTASKGTFALVAQDNTGNFAVNIKNRAHGQASDYWISDLGVANPSLLGSVLANTDKNSNMFWVDITAGFAALGTAAKVEVAAAAAGKQYIPRDLRVNYLAAGLSGGGGDRLLSLSDGTTVYNGTGITAALLGTPVNTVWGGSGNPLPGTVSMDTPTVAGAQLFLQYIGGTTDYTAGEVSVSILLERVA